MKPFTTQDSKNWHILWNSEEGWTELGFLHFGPFLLNIINIRFFFLLQLCFQRHWLTFSIGYSSHTLNSSQSIWARVKGFIPPSHLAWLLLLKRKPSVYETFPILVGCANYGCRQTGLPEMQRNTQVNENQSDSPNKWVLTDSPDLATYKQHEIWSCKSWIIS